MFGWVCFWMLGLSGLSASGQKTPVVVELFTSEGCSSCPPADALLAKLDKEQPVAGAEILVLEEHVDYWEELGWHDRFSSHVFTERQNGYGRRFNLPDVYTPEMVVDGAVEFVGNDSAKALKAIGQPAHGEKIALVMTDILKENGRVTGAVSAAHGAGLGKGDLYAALVDASATTIVKGGENGGRTLRHVGVVRSLVRIGSVEDLAKGSVRFALNVPADGAEKERVVVFAQRSGQGVVAGAAVGVVGEAQGGQKSVAMR
jgi:hypothetical protein